MIVQREYSYLLKAGEKSSFQPTLFLLIKNIILEDVGRSIGFSRGGSNFAHLLTIFC
jgi:hypothetical protein